MTSLSPSSARKKIAWEAGLKQLLGVRVWGNRDTKRKLSSRIIWSFEASVHSFGMMGERNDVFTTKLTPNLQFSSTVKIPNSIKVRKKVEVWPVKFSAGLDYNFGRDKLRWVASCKVWIPFGFPPCPPHPLWGVGRSFGTNYCFWFWSGETVWRQD